jgi:inosose dehydratase
VSDTFQDNTFQDTFRVDRPVIRVANAPVSYGAFELTVGILPNVPPAGQVLEAIRAAGYEGTELGPLGYLPLDRLDGLELVGAFVQIDFGADDLTELHRTLEAIDGFDAKAVLCDSGPRDGDVDLDGVARAADAARARGFEPTFHHHLGTRVQTPAEIERLLDGTDVPLLLDTGHLTAAGGDAVESLRAWRDRINYLHLKDVRADTFCELGTGDVDLDGFIAELAGYDGWIVVEQDWIPQPGEDPAEQIEAQVRNRNWLRERGI